MSIGERSFPTPQWTERVASARVPRPSPIVASEETMRKTVIALTFAAIACVPFGADAKGPPSRAALEGKWVMHLYLGDRLFDDQVELAAGPGGALRGTLTVPGRFTVPVEKLVQTGRHFAFQITADEGRGPFHVRYEGDLHDGGDTYVGFATVLDDGSLLGGFVGQRR
jgi:hypothetical protein